MAAEESPDLLEIDLKGRQANPAPGPFASSPPDRQPRARVEATVQPVVSPASVGPVIPVAPPLEPTERSSTTRRIVRDVLETAIFTIAIFLLVRSTIQPYRIAGSSMEPNFSESQFLLVNKLAYLLDEPAHGDVIVFHHPDGSDIDVIKRVIGVPGNTIEIRQGQLFINNLPTSEPYPVLSATYDMPPVLVGTGMLYVLGDNRADSADSHTWGLLSQTNLVGKAWLSLLPLHSAGLVEHQPVVVSVPGAS